MSKIERAIEVLIPDIKKMNERGLTTMGDNPKETTVMAWQLAYRLLSAAEEAGDITNEQFQGYCTRIMGMLKPYLPEKYTKFSVLKFRPGIYE